MYDMLPRCVYGWKCYKISCLSPFSSFSSFLVCGVYGIIEAGMSMTTLKLVFVTYITKQTEPMCNPP
ncbi:hypothetical protein P167DRAFT_205461 [Morchella conica CCBAS932]|uniref:Uncharacterized protein n=1 Tax=Morchella conica CCBAS932 TaxID=1392247 RepID=A0A3N4L2M2_9PEZI|nr:hypothetical protein P167DRAFT_205461 [Morchella conica CCBAS932]